MIAERSGLIKARERIERLPISQIREIANTGVGLEGLIPLWIGESDLSTPDFIKKAGADAPMRGYTFYTHNRGIPELRSVLAAYLTRLHAYPVDVDPVTVTASGCGDLHRPTSLD